MFITKMKLFILYNQCFSVHFSNCFEYHLLFSNYFQHLLPIMPDRQCPILLAYNNHLSITNMQQYYHTLQKISVVQLHSVHLSLEDIVLRVLYLHHDSYRILNNLLPNVRTLLHLSFHNEENLAIHHKFVIQHLNMRLLLK